MSVTENFATMEPSSGSLSGVNETSLTWRRFGSVTAVAWMVVVPPEVVAPGLWTIGVSGEFAKLYWPDAFCAFTWTKIALPMSAEVTVYVEPVAPGIGVQLPRPSLRTQL